MNEKDTTNISVSDVHQDTGARLSFCPKRAESLVQPAAAEWPVIAFDVALIATPLLLIVKAVLVVVAFILDSGTAANDIDDVSQLTLELVKFNTQLTTLFTIIFATILSTLVRRIALWRAQKGATVAELEQLQASISLPGTLKIIWSLRMFTMTSVALVAVWGFYYVGSQASSNEYKYRNNAPLRRLQATVTNTQGPSVFSDQYYGSLNDSQKVLLNADFTMAMATLQLFQPPTGYDQQGNMILPYIDNNATLKYDWLGYLDFSKPSNVQYVSVVGLNVFAALGQVLTAVDDRGAMIAPPQFLSEDLRMESIPHQYIGKLHFNASYVDVKCTPSEIRNMSAFPATVTPNMSVAIELAATNTSFSGGPISFALWRQTGNNTNKAQAVSSTCNMTTVSMQVQALCNNQGCSVKKAKPIATINGAGNQTIFGDSNVIKRFFSELVMSTGSPSGSSEATIVENSIYPLDIGAMDACNLNFPLGSENCETLFNNLSCLTNVFQPNYSASAMNEVQFLTMLEPNNLQTSATASHCTTDQTRSEVETVLQYMATWRSGAYVRPVINTYLTLSQQHQAAPILKALSREDQVAAFNGKSSSPFLSIAQGVGAYYNPEYHMSIPWLTADFVSCIVLLIAGSIAVHLRKITIAPDILGYVSSMTRDNPHMKLSQTASALDGTARARWLKQMKVQIVDVEADAETGRVALVQVHNEGLRSEMQLKKGRYYE